jgi:hypothetical protein
MAEAEGEERRDETSNRVTREPVPSSCRDFVTGVPVSRQHVERK